MERIKRSSKVDATEIVNIGAFVEIYQYDYISENEIYNEYTGQNETEYTYDKTYFRSTAKNYNDLTADIIRAKYSVSEELKAHRLALTTTEDNYVQKYYAYLESAKIEARKIYAN